MLLWSLNLGAAASHAATIAATEGADGASVSGSIMVSGSLAPAEHADSASVPANLTAPSSWISCVEASDIPLFPCWIQAPGPITRGRDIRLDVAARLMATNLFQTADVTGPPEDVGEAASRGSAAFIEPISGQEDPRWDGGDQMGLVVSEKCRLTVAARENDPRESDEAVERLMEAAKNAINGQQLASLTIPDRTYLSDWRWLPRRSAERRIVCTLRYDYLIGWSDNDETL